MRDTGYNPPASELDRIAATEYQTAPARGMVRGSVHDENAWSLNGVAGHAGVFSTADDLAVLAQTIINGGSYGKTRILEHRLGRRLAAQRERGVPGQLARARLRARPEVVHGRPLVIPRPLATPATPAPRSSSTGESQSFVILLTNRVHPSRNWGSNNPARRAVARDMALAIPVRPREGRTAWFSGVGDARTATLTVPVQLSSAPSRLTFDLWYDTEQTDVVTLEASSDGGSTWQELAHWSGWSGKKWGTAVGRPGCARRRRHPAVAVHLRRAVPGPRCLRRRHPRDVAGPHRLRRLPSAGRGGGAACGLVGASPEQPDGRAGNFPPWPQPRRSMPCSSAPVDPATPSLAVRLRSILPSLSRSEQRVAQRCSTTREASPPARSRSWRSGAAPRRPRSSGSAGPSACPATRSSA